MLRLLALGALVVAVGCTKPKPLPELGVHSHGTGPHGGAVADWGPYHVEFMVDHGAQQATVYVLADDGKTAAPIAAEKIKLAIDDPAFEILLPAEPQDGETGGESSRFVGQHENLATVREFSGSISGETSGAKYSAKFAEEPPTP